MKTTEFIIMMAFLAGILILLVITAGLMLGKFLHKALTEIEKTEKGTSDDEV